MEDKIVNDTASKFIESGKLNEFTYGIYADEIAKHIKSINYYLKTSMDINQILESMPQWVKFKPSHIDARNLMNLIREYVSCLGENTKAALVAKRVREEFGW